MSDTGEPRSDLLRDPQFLSFLRETDPEPLVSGGDIPNAQETPYVPNIEELVDGARAAAETNRTLSEARVEVIEDRARMLFQGSEGAR